MKNVKKILNNSKQNNSDPKATLIFRILTGAFIVSLSVTAFFAFRLVRDFFISTNVFQLPGVSVQAESGDDNATGDTGEDTTNNSPTVITVDDVEVDFAGRINVLIMGLDYRDWEDDPDAPSRTDTMMLLTVDPVTYTAGMLSIPRDLWVNVPGYGQNKINTAYFLGQANRLPEGGPGLAVKTVEEFLGIDIQYWAQVDFTAFVQFIDYIGGVKIDVKEPLKLELIGQEKKEKLQPGTYTLDGARALAYARNRKDGDGDFSRAKRQQEVVLAIRDQMLRRDVQKIFLSNPQGIWDLFSEGIKTNVPFDDAFKLGILALRINPAQINQWVISPPDYVTLATSPDGLSILKPITQNIRILRDQIFTPVGQSGPSGAGGDPLTLMQQEAAAIGVYNGSSVGGLAGSTQEYLQGMQMNIADAGNADYVPATTIYDYTGNPYTVQYLVDLMNIQNTRIFNSYDPNSTIDVAIVLGDDWQVP